MGHKAVGMVYSMRLELTHEGLLVSLANYDMTPPEMPYP